MTNPDSPPLPSYQILRKAGRPPRLTGEAMRLFWTLQDSLSTSIFLMDETRNPDGPREAYFRQTLAGVSWHPASQASLTEPPISSITVVVDPLEMWEESWLESHRHAEPGDEGCVFGEVEGEDEDEEPELLRCCGEDRPKKTAPLVVESSEKPYVTVHDYLSAVHPWLMGLREDILRAKNVWEGRPLPVETKLMVNYYAPEDLMIDDEKGWLAHVRGGRNLRM